MEGIGVASEKMEFNKSIRYSEGRRRKVGVGKAAGGGV